MKAPKATKMPMFKVKPIASTPTPKFQGKGTRARLNTAATKSFFGSKFSK